LFPSSNQRIEKFLSSEGFKQLIMTNLPDQIINLLLIYGLLAQRNLILGFIILNWNIMKFSDTLLISGDKSANKG